MIANLVKGTHYTINGLPASLTAKLDLHSTKKKYYIWLNGAAVNHANSDDTSFTITFDKSIFKNPPASNDDIIGRTQTFQLDFQD